MKEPFFIMRNNHSENCGTPPTITNETANKTTAILKMSLVNSGYLCMTE
jgi:hypothetical protein